MSSTATMTTVQTSSIRQPPRQTRTNPTRTSRSNGRSLSGLGSLARPTQEPSDAQNGPIGFYPAIQHFTDAITALPREFRRHTSLLKEVDAKAWSPEERLAQTLDQVLALPHPKTPSKPTLEFERHDDHNVSIAAQNGSAANSVIDNTSQASVHNEAAVDYQRRQQFYNLRIALTENLMTIDEKNHVLGEASTTVTKQLTRLDAVLPHVENEVSEEARCGNLSHWAYSTDKPAPVKSGTTANERARRADHAAAIVLDNEVAARSELRREAMNARKQRKDAVDSDFDEPKVPPKRTNGHTKAKRPGDTLGPDSNLGLGISGNPPTTKRRKVEKPSIAAVAMERSLSGALSNNIRGTSREASMPEPVKKRRALPTTGNGTRKRNNTAASGAGSPNLASSPVVGTFSRDQHRASPAPTSIQRPQSSRARQNSAQNADPRGRPSSSASNKPTNGNVMANTLELSTVTALTGKTASEVKASMKETVNGKGDRLLEEEGENADLRGGILLSKDKSLKREDPEANGESAKTTEQIVTSRGRTSKTSTPVIATFPEPRSRPSRNNDAPKRSHKKGAGLAAQLQAAHAADDEGSSMQGDDEDDEEDANAPRYCYCNEISYGEMVACDNENCPTEWFHLSCVGLMKAPSKSAKWYCEDCKDSMKKGKSGGNR